jgi:hypothetical protein
MALEMRNSAVGGILKELKRIKLAEFLRIRTSVMIFQVFGLRSFATYIRLMEVLQRKLQSEGFAFGLNGARPVPRLIITGFGKGISNSITRSRIFSVLAALRPDAEWI